MLKKFLVSVLFCGISISAYGVNSDTEEEQDPGRRRRIEHDLNDFFLERDHKEAAELGVPEAQHNHAFHLNVLGNKDEALRYFQLAANQGHVDASHWYGMHLFEKAKDLDKDHPISQEIFKYLNFAADSLHR